MSVLVCMGTRPEIIKMAPVVKALAAHGLQPVVMHTGQHEDMAWPLYEFFGFPPDQVIKLQRSVPGLAGLSSELLLSITQVIERTQPHAVLVHGDTTSAAMGALAAFYQQIPVGHVEAGLRSGTRQEPFPEEMNRQLIGRMADWHFAPTAGAVQNLAREGTTQGVLQVGNTVVDAANWATQRLQQMRVSMDEAQHNWARQWFVRSGCQRLIVVTAHRRENWGEPMRGIIHAALELLQDDPQLAIVWPVHLNPIVKDSVLRAHALAPASVRARWHLTQPLNYPELIDLMACSDVLLTDSGGIQEEAVALKKPVLILRNVTERPEVVECGLGQLVGTSPQAIVAAVQSYFQATQIRAAKHTGNPFGDGTAAEQIAQFLSQQLAALPLKEAA